MKTGLLTFHAADNFGAVLQAAALQQYIDSNICDCELIDFVPNNCIAQKALPYRAKRAVLKLHWLLKKNTAAKFAAFRKKNFKLSHRKYYADEALFANAPAYDVVISGSDQILNTTLSGTSESFYLRPWKQTKKITYASSFGRTELSQDEYRLIRSELSGFSHLSAREQSAAQLLSEELGREVPVVTDPVFLLHADAWAEKCEEVPNLGAYTFVYAMEYSKIMENAILQQMQHSRVYVLCGSQSAQKLPGNKIMDCGPGEFLSYIKNAGLVLTNSFHGTAFSIIFNKPLLCVAHTTRNARLQNIMQQSQNPDKLITQSLSYDAMMQLAVDGKQAYCAMEPQIEASKQYLKTALEH